MGTQQSNSGPGDTTPLLPVWALKPQPPVNPIPIPLPVDPLEPTTVQPQTTPVVPTPPVAPIVKPPKYWESARRALGKAIKTGGRGNWKAASSRYVAARGGSRSAAASSAAGRRATTSVASFLGNVATRGLNEALRAIGLERLIGSDALTVVTAVANAICPPGGSADDAVARQATTEVLAWLYDKYGQSEDALSRLEKLGQPELAEVIGESITRYIFNRWLEELGKKIEDSDISADQAVRIERDVLDFVRESVKLDFAGQQLTSIDWQSTMAAQLIETIYADAYRMLE
jgi:hypothetical protein